MPQWMQDLIAGWPMIRANLPMFFIIVVLIIGAVWWVMGWRYGDLLATKNGQIEMQDRQLAEYREKLKGATPDQAKSRIDALEARLTQATSHRWQSLTETQVGNLSIALKKLPAPTALRIVCGGSDCTDLAESLSKIFNGVGWPVKPEYGFYFDTPTGIAISQKNVEDRGIADALEGASGLRIAMSPTDLLSTTIFIGMKPLP
jgi:hypothetical protein